MMGEEVFIELQTEYTLSCTPSWIQESVTSGTWRIRIDNPGKNKYRISCVGEKGTTPIEKEVEIVALAPKPTAVIDASSLDITKGQKDTLSWTSTNATTCSAPWTTLSLPQGSQEITPTQTQNYSISCSGPGGSVVSNMVTITVTDIVPKPTVILSASTLSIVRGQNSRLSWSSTGATSCSAPWTTNTLAQGTQDVSPSQTQNYSISCSGPGGSTVSNGVTVTVTNPPISSFSVQVFGAQPSPEGVTGLRFYLFLGNTVDSVNIGSDGTVSVVPSSALPDSFYVAVDAQNTTTRRFYPMDFKVSKNDALLGLRIPLIPYSWTVEEKLFTGQRIAVNFEDLYRPSVSGDLSFFVRQPEYIPVSGQAPWVYAIETWPKEVDIPVAFNRTVSTGTISASDSATVMGFFKDLETYVPYRFKAVNAVSLPPNTGFQIYLFNDAGYGSGSYDANNGTIVVGYVSAHNRTVLLDKRTMQHEIFHALGLGHTCGWKTLMSSGCSSNLQSQTPELQDIAYLELKNRIVEIQRRERTRWGIPHAWQGYRVRVQGLGREDFKVKGFVP